MQNTIDTPEVKIDLHAFLKAQDEKSQLRLRVESAR